MGLNKGVVGIIGFVVGAATGAAATYIYTTKKYEELSAKESEDYKKALEEVKEQHEKVKKSAEKILEKEEPEEEPQDEEPVSNQGYFEAKSSITDYYKNKVKDEGYETKTIDIYEIEEEEIAEKYDDWDVYGYMLSSDGGVVDENGEAMSSSDIYDNVGDCLDDPDKIGDTVYIANTSKRRIYEVVKDRRTTEQLIR